MIEDAPIVKDTRRVRSLISNRFGNDLDKYLAYLRTNKQRQKPGVKAQVREESSENRPKDYL